MRPLSAWPDALEATIAKRCRIFTSVRVLAETASTQDVARGFADRPGAVVVAARQTQGRGRLGRSWRDTGDEGLAVTFCCPDDPLGHRLVLASSVAAARAIEGAIRGAIKGARSLSVGIKWPNDLMVGGRKLGGILIERVATGDARVALVGIGINVRQREFPADLADGATSILREGVDLDRLDLLVGLVAALDEALGDSVEALTADYLARDALRGRDATFGTPAGEVIGRVVQAHPVAGLTVDTAVGVMTLPTATTIVLSWTESDGRLVDKRGRT